MKTIRLVAAVPVLLLVAACGAGANSTASESGNGSSAAGSADSSADESSPAALDNGAAPARASMKSGSALHTTAVETRAVISKGQISLQAKDVEKTRFNLQRLLDGWNGTISSDESSADSQGRTVDERLVLRVPSASFGTAMTEIAKLGKLTDQSRTSEDVTTQVIDNSVRVRAQKLSLARIEALLAQAKNLNQIIAIEGQLSSRQADLDSLESQQKYLADQTTLSTITVYLSAHPKAVVHKEKKHGFVGGLENGWTAFKDSAVAVLTVVGAVLPFAVLIGLIGVPVGLVIRRRRALHQAPPAEA